MFTTFVPELNLVNAKLHGIIADLEEPAKNICTYILNRGGKRLRPALVILSAKCFSKKYGEELLATAVSAELIHLASLIHDDVIDEAALRHGQVTAHLKWDNRTAILAGDILFAKAFQILTEYRITEILNLMIEAITAMCCGEIKQAISSFDLKQEERGYYDRIRKKTGKLIATCCQAGSILADATASSISNLQAYGLNLGYAFQITDDILDFVGKKEKLGKGNWEDIGQGIYTLPIISLLKNPLHGDFLRENLRNKKLTEAAKEKISQLLFSSGALEHSKQIAIDYQKKACNYLQELPDTSHRQILHDIAGLAVSRCY